MTLFLKLAHEEGKTTGWDFDDQERNACTMVEEGRDSVLSLSHGLRFLCKCEGRRSFSVLSFQICNLGQGVH